MSGILHSFTFLTRGNTHLYSIWLFKYKKQLSKIFLKKNVLGIFCFISAERFRFWREDCCVEQANVQWIIGYDSQLNAYHTINGEEI